MKESIDADTKIAKEAKELVQECVSEFISFITCEASLNCQTQKRKTINGDDIIQALTTLGFENYVEILSVYLQKYRQVDTVLHRLGTRWTRKPTGSLELRTTRGTVANKPNHTNLSSRQTGTLDQVKLLIQFTG